jgi:CheY-like chemotaxis protein
MSATPTVYFIDDSATMREVIKIAFRRENINVVAYNDAASALIQIEASRPDVVITDVIMPDKDGYEVCQFIKQHAALSNIPVILMSGVVNKAVAEKAFSVKADELIRKPFQPQDLITRVRHLLGVTAPAPAPHASAAAALTSIFQQPASAPATGRPRSPAPSAPAGPSQTPQFQTAAQTFAAATVPGGPQPQVVPLATPATPSAAATRPGAAAAPGMASSGDLQKLRIEVMRLEGLVKKLQSELVAEREYTRSLEEHVKTLREAD